MRGVAGTMSYAIRWPLVIYNERRSLGQRTAIQSDFDRRNGTDTGGIIPLSSFTIENPNWVHGVRYAPTSPEGFLNSLSLLDLSPALYGNFTFVDIGSGKGATMLYAADLGFKAVVGVEFVDALHQVALKNLAVYPAARRIGKSICMDAMEYEMPKTPLVVFMNYPFSSQHLMKGVLDNIAKSSGSPKYLVTLNFPYDPSTLPGCQLKTINRTAVGPDRHHYAFQMG